MTRPYTGSLDYYGGLLASAAVGLHLERCAIRRRLIRESEAKNITASWLPKLRRDVEIARAAIEELEQAIAETKESEAA